MDNQPQSISTNYEPRLKTEPHSDKSSNLLVVLAIIGIITGCLGTTFGVLALMRQDSEPAATIQTPGSATASPTVSGYYTGNNVQLESNSIADIAQKVTPAIVSIVSSTRSNTGSFLDNYFSGQSAGTGMIVTSDGYVVTNKHVVEDAKSIQVITDDGRTFEQVKIVAEDPFNDVAYLKIVGASDLPTVTLGDSKTIAVGQSVLAIGNALGAYQNSVTQGIVSGIGRSLEASDSNGLNSETLSDMIQTDAAINPGNSGGPLVNAAGDVIGINTAVSTNAQGLGFAIPISAVKGMLNNLINNGQAQRAYLGIAYVTVTPTVANEYDLPVTSGAYIYSSSNRQSAVVSGGPADRAGLRSGDIITEFNDVPLGNAGSLSTLAGEYMAGETIKLTFLRGDQTMTTELTLGSY